MKKLLLHVIVGLFSFIATAQTTADLTGSWQFYTIKTKRGTTKSQYDGAVSIMGTMSLQLNADKTSITSLMGMKEQGQWEVKNNTLVFTSPTDKTSSFKITAYEKNIVTLDKDKFEILLSRVGADVPPPPSFKEERVYATANAAQLTKKWYLKQRPAPENLTEKQKEAFGEMLSGSYVELKANGKCTLQLGDKKETGQWNLNEKKNGITTTLKNMPKEAYFIKATTTELIVTEADSADEWIFSSVE